MATITIEIPEEISCQFTTEEDMKRTVFEDFVIGLRQSGNLSLGEAARLLNITYIDFFRLIGQKGTSFINATKDELENSYHLFTKMIESNNS
jgi:predicted HTH domain antitoxin